MKHRRGKLPGTMGRGKARTAATPAVVPTKAGRTHVGSRGRRRRH